MLLILVWPGKMSDSVLSMMRREKMTVVHNRMFYMRCLDSLCRFLRRDTNQLIIIFKVKMNFFILLKVLHPCAISRRRYCTPDLKSAYFVCYLKTFNTVFEK